MKRNKKIIIILTAVFFALIAAFFIYTLDYYHASENAYTEYKSESADLTETETDIPGIGKAWVIEPENPVSGFIFYPGGKVEYDAYLPLMRKCAQNGILCVLLKMPLNLAVLDMNAADGVREAFPDIEDWYIGGHSLGGAVASIYVSKHPGEYEGLILLASYSSKDISDENIKVLSVYGSNDGVMNRSKYEKFRTYLPQNFSEVVIDGGCHAYFGFYGAQSGDGEPSISVQEQTGMTAEAIIGFVRH